jgi:hypothetical protein
MTANVAGQRLQGLKRIFDDEQRRCQDSIRQSGYAGQGDDCGNRSALKSGGKEVVAVEALAADGEEQLAGKDGARVDRVSSGEIRTDADGAGWGFQLGAATQSGLG